MTHSVNRRRFLWQATAILGGTLGLADIRAASAPPLHKTPSGDLLETVARGDLPSFGQKGGPKVQEAYRYAAANADTLQYIPCFCGCKNIGHRHNGDCYVTERHADGRVTFNSHAVT
ncbi:MAG: PCYCGC motif-containing (lipo)protein [Candidatus Methylomirabilales bacterium]